MAETDPMVITDLPQTDSSLDEEANNSQSLAFQVQTHDSAESSHVITRKGQSHMSIPIFTMSILRHHSRDFGVKRVSK